MRTGERMGPEGWEIQLRTGSLDLAVLASLWDRPCHGLEIIDRVDRSVGLTVPEGTIYPLLSRLERGGLISARWNREQAARPRRYYSLSASGRRRARCMKRICVEHMKSLAQLVEPIEENL